MKKLFDSIFSYNGVLLIPAFIIIFLVWSGFGSIMTRLGFETTTSLKSQLTELTVQFKMLKEENKNLKNKLRVEILRCEILTDIIEKQDKEDNEIDRVVDDINKSVDIPKPQEEVKDDTVKEDDEEEPHLNRNIVRINVAYNTFFGG